MKKLLTIYLMLLNIPPLLAYPRDDRDSGTSGITLLIVIILPFLLFLFHFGSRQFGTIYNWVYKLRKE